MNNDVPYMVSVKNLAAMLAKAQKAAVPETFTFEFLRDLGFTSSNDRGIVKVLKYLGFLDASGRPQDSYREFVDHNRTKEVLGERLRIAFDDLFISDKNAQTKTVDDLKGWFKSKTGKGDAVAMKMATTFKTLATNATFGDAPATPKKQGEILRTLRTPAGDQAGDHSKQKNDVPSLGLVYRLEIHLPDTQNIDTFRAIFKALREELS